ncbi:MAG TPA: M23 family metallopeptidase [Armatimonadota bacterium]
MLKRRTQIKTKITKVRQALKTTKQREYQTRTRLHQVEGQVRIARGQLQYWTLQLHRKQSELHTAKQALASAIKRYSNLQDDAGDRLVALYERGPQGYAEVVLSSDDFGEVLQRAELANFIKEDDRLSLDELKEHEQKIAAYHAQVREKTEEVAGAKTQVALRHESLDHKRKNVQQNVKELHGEAAALQAELDALERDSRAVTGMLQAMRATPAGRRRYNTNYAGPVGGLPVRGRITSGFGYRYHPVLRTRRLHTGIDIAAPMGTPIFAAGGGEVISAGWRGGYGNCVIIDHGHGKATLYGHMSAILVHCGQTVSRSTQIGRVGSTGMSTGPHCHYEVRINGTPVSPL